MRYILSLLTIVLTFSTASAQLLPWRRGIAQRLRQLERKQQQQQPPIIVIPPYQQLPIDGQPRQPLPIPGDPKQRPPIPGDPKQNPPIGGDPKQPLPGDGGPGQVLPDRPGPQVLDDGPQAFSQRAFAIYRRNYIPNRR